MNKRPLIIATKWVAGVGLYVVLSAFVSLAFVLSMMKWEFGNDDSPGLGIFMFFALVPVFVVSLFWGLIYASAIAGPKKFGKAWRVWIHFGLSHFLGLLSFTILWRGLLTPLPNFQSDLAARVFIVSILGFSVVSLLLGVFARVHLSRRKHLLLQIAPS